MIEIRDLSKRFGGIQAVNGLSLSAPDGEVTGLIGPNGAGKTTTFRILYGAQRPDAGTASIDGLDVVSARTEIPARLGALPETRGLYPRLSAREHLRYFGELHGLRGPSLEARIDELVTRLEMAEIADRRTLGFSRGQELKVALGRALIHRPRNLILDEPTNGLDVVSSRAVRGLIREMRDAGHCIVIASHVMAEVAALCDRMVIIARGRALLAGTLAQLRHAGGSHDLEDIYVAAVTGVGTEP